MDAFDADVLIYAATPGHALGSRVLQLFAMAGGSQCGIGSELLLPELLAKPLREADNRQRSALTALLRRLDLCPVDAVTARLATSLAARYKLRVADCVHLATGVNMGADRFITNNRKDFPQTITEVDVTYPDAL